MKKTNLIQHLASVAIRLLTPAIINAEGHFRIYKGKLITEDEFNQLHPYIALKEIDIKGSNPDKRKGYLKGVKSY